MKKLFYLFIFMLFLFFSLPSSEKINATNTIYLYENNQLKSFKNENELTNDEKEKIDNIINNNTSIIVENNKTFSTYINDPEFSNKLSNSVKLVDGYQVNIDDKILYIDNEENFNVAMKNIIQNYFPSKDSFSEYLKNNNQVTPVVVGDKTFVDFELNNNIDIIKTKVPEQELLKTEADIRYNITNYQQTKQIKVVNEGDTIESILKEYNLTQEEFMQNNNLSSNTLLYEGMELIVNKANNILNIETYYEYTNREVLPYQVEKVADANLRVGQEKITKYGINGEQDVIYKMKLTNGNYQSHQAVSYNIIKQSQNEVINVGTTVVSGYGTGNLRWPGSSCRITNGYGGADFVGIGHLAIDIQSWYGAPIYAADNGVVEYSGWDPYGGGWSIKINHNNGLKTYYCHMMNPPNAKVGQNVERGQVIGYEGASGTATGEHLHFEVIVNGSRTNPLKYVSC